MRRGERATFGLALTASGVCLGTAAVYAKHPSDGPGWWLATMATLGAAALGAAGLWQARSDRVPRLLALVVLAGLAAGYVAANVLALVTPSGSGLPDAPEPLHAVGAIAGALLYGTALVEASRAFMRRHPAND